MKTGWSSEVDLDAVETGSDVASFPAGLRVISTGNQPEINLAGFVWGSDARYRGNVFHRQACSRVAVATSGAARQQSVMVAVQRSAQWWAAGGSRELMFMKVQSAALRLWYEQRGQRSAVRHQTNSPSCCYWLLVEIKSTSCWDSAETGQSELMLTECMESRFIR